MDFKVDSRIQMLLLATNSFREGPRPLGAKCKHSVGSEHATLHDLMACSTTYVVSSLHNFFSPASKIRSACQSVFSVLGRVVVLEPTTMVGSMSFSSRARISVIPCFAVQSIAAPFLGCQQNSCWNGRQTEVDSPTMVKTIHLTLLTVSLLAT